jgi:hypothetical protein
VVWLLRDTPLIYPCPGNYNRYDNYIRERENMSLTKSTVISMRLPFSSGKRLKRMASRHGWTPSDASARFLRR